MKLTILGSGVTMPSLTRNAAGYYLKIGTNHVLIDCGSGTLRQLLKAKVKWQELDYIFISHRHPDHITDLMAIMHAIYVAGHFNNQRIKPLVLVGYKGFKQDYHYFRQATFPAGRESYSIKIMEIKQSAKQFSSWRVRATSVEHGGLEVNAYRFEHQGKSLVLGSDCDYDQNLVKICHQTDLAVLDCMMPIVKKLPGHMSPKECGQTAKEARVKKIVLTHINPKYDNINLKKQAKKYYQGPVVIAKDLMTIKI